MKSRGQRKIYTAVNKEEEKQLEGTIAPVLVIPPSKVEKAMEREKGASESNRFLQMGLSLLRIC